MRRDAPVSDYLPELAGTPAGAAPWNSWPPTTAGCRPYRRACPRLGARRVGQRESVCDECRDLVAAHRDTPLGTPGHFAYSNLGMSLLGHAEARAAGAVDWPALARQRLLVPLGMTNTTFVTAADQIPAGTATPHKDNGWRAPHWYGAAFTPAGTSTYTTAEDMMKYARAVVERQAPGLAALDPVADADEGRIGLAWITSEMSGRTLTWHNGNTGGYRSMLALDRAPGPSRPRCSAAPRRSVDDPGLLELAAAASAAEIAARTALPPRPRSDRGLPHRSACSWCPVAVALLRTRHRIAALPRHARPRAVTAARCCATRAVGPDTGAELWSALVGLVLARRHSRLPPRQPASPGGPERHRWASRTVRRIIRSPRA